MISGYLPARFFSIVLAIFFVGCAGDAFKAAREKNTIAAYDQFLLDYGDSEFAPEAMKLKEFIIFEKTKGRNTIFGYDQHLNDYPNGSFVLEVNKLRQKKEQQGCIKHQVSESIANGGVTN